MERGRIRWNGWNGADDALAANGPAWHWLTQALAMPALLATPPRELAGIALPASRLTDKARQKLAAVLGASAVRQDDFERARHAAGRGLVDLLRLRGGDLSEAPDAVLYVRQEADVLAVLSLCAELNIAVIPFGGGTGDIETARGDHGTAVALNLSGLYRVTEVDAVSGLADVQAGITGPELERHLATRGMMLGHRPDDFEFSTLGGWIAEPGAGQEEARAGGVGDWLRGVRVATPQGLIISAGMPDLTHLMLGSRGALGIVTSATIRIRAMAAKEDYRRYLFPDFASGLAAMREAQRIGLPHTMLRLWDDGETRFSNALERAGRGRNLAGHFLDVYLSVRRFDGQAASLVAGFSGGEAARKQFDALARRLGALALGMDTKWPEQRFAAGVRRDTLLDRGVGMDSLSLSVSWAALPSLYVRMRAALKQAMRSHVPCSGAHGLVLCHVGPARADGATMTFTWLFPRKLDDEIGQAQAIRQAALAASAGRNDGDEKLKREVLRGIKQVLDPSNILNPGIRVG